MTACNDTFAFLSDEDVEMTDAPIMTSSLDNIVPDGAWISPIHDLLDAAEAQDQIETDCNELPIVRELLDVALEQMKAHMPDNGDQMVPERLTERGTSNGICEKLSVSADFCNLVDFNLLLPFDFESRAEFQLGTGASSDVFCASLHGRMVAVKRFRMWSKLNIPFLLQRELNTLRVAHRNLLDFVGVTMNAAGHPCIITELMDGSLEDLSSQLELRQVVSVLRQVACGMAALHAHGIMHRDLKQANVLYARHGNSLVVKVADFGLSRVAADKMTNFVGTPAYCAPEVLQTTSYTVRADVYSFGLLMWELLSQSRAYEDHYSNPVALAMAVVHGARPSIHALPASLPTGLVELIQRCWSCDPQLRPSFSDIATYLAGVHDALQ